MEENQEKVEAKEIWIEGRIDSIAKLEDECTISLITKTGLVNIEVDPDDKNMIEKCNKYLEEDYNILCRGSWTDEEILQVTDVKFNPKED